MRSSRTSVPGSSGEGVLHTDRVELLDDLSAQLALVETASIALQKFADQQEIGAICAALEHAVHRLADVYERVRRYLRREQS
jgi:hypothetical protein